METGKERNKKKHTASGRSAGIRITLFAVMLLAASVGMLFGVYRCINGFLEQSDLIDMEQMAEHDFLMVQSNVQNSEEVLQEWANLIRCGGYTDLQEVLEEITQGASMLGCKRLYLVDTDFFYYGSDGLIARYPQYDGGLKANVSETATFRDAGENRVLICSTVKPFTVETVTFHYVLAEYESETYLRSLSRGLLSEEDRTVLSAPGMTAADAAVWDTFGFSSEQELMQALTGKEILTAAGEDEDGTYLRVCLKIGNTELFLLMRYRIHVQTAVKKWILAVCLIITVCCLTAVAGILVLLYHGGKLKGQLLNLKSHNARLEQTLEAAEEANRIQTEFIDRISYDIRTPLNSIVGYTALARRHIREAEWVGAYLEKSAEASAQLLSHLERGLGRTEAEPVFEPVAEAEPTDLVGRRVLLVEDNEMNREIACTILSDAGMVTEYAANGQECFQMVSISKPDYYDLVLMDIQMPVMDGCEAARMIRRLRSKKLAEIPIIAMTASVTDADKRSAFQSGMDGYVEKPIQIERLFSAIKQVLCREIEQK